MPVEAAREPLCKLDAATGDGDHGLTMTIGARAVRRQLDRTAGDDPAVLVKAVASAMGSVGGAIGPLYGRGLAAAADVIAASGEAPDDAARIALVRRAAAAAAASVVSLGGAKPGDKTVLDALLPFVAALAAAEDRSTSESLAEAVRGAAAAARSGAEATVSMEARVGRSSRFGERSIGTPDPGATSFAIIAEALARVVT